MAHPDRVCIGSRLTSPVATLGALLLVGLAGCRYSGEVAPPPAVEPEALSLLGQPLYPPPLPEEVREQRTAELATAAERYAASHADHDSIVWLGRRTAYLGRYRDAIDIYSDGLALYPESHELLRHRGHRYISVREFDLAIADLERAAALIADRPDEIEPDGLPNARNTPTSTSHSNIWYHLGLAYYLQGDFENALRCYRECMKFSNNPDMLCATSHWLYMTLRRLERDDEAAAVLEPIHADLDVIENRTYLELLLMYRGELSPADVLPEGEGDSIQSATGGYGVANWHAYNGRTDEARAMLERVVAGEQWSAFGYIAAEADLARTN